MLWNCFWRYVILELVMKKILGLLGIVVLLGAGCAASEPENTQDEVVEIDRDAILMEAKDNGLILSDEESKIMKESMQEDSGESMETGLEAYLNQDFKGWESAALADVTGGESFGLAYAKFENGTYTMVAKFGNLPTLGEGYFYEGWVVRRGEDFSVISSGPAVVTEDGFVNIYQSQTDLIDHDFYVLTLEPDDGDPAPAEHILEGTLK